MAVRKLSALLRRITSKHHADFYCMNCLYSAAIENKREYQKKVCEKKDFCSVVMPFEDNETLEFSQY